MLDIRLSSPKEMLVMLKGMLAMFLLLSLKLPKEVSGLIKECPQDEALNIRHHG